MTTTRVLFVHEMQELKEELAKMGKRTEEAIEHSIQALKEQDLDLAKQIILNDREINDMEKTVESRCLALILKQQPVARDLRDVSAALKVVTDLERIGDHAADIAELVLRKEASAGFAQMQDISEMAEAAKSMVKEAIHTFIQGNMIKAREIMKKDDEIDTLFAKVKQDVVELLKSNLDIADRCIDMLMVAKYLERIGDHAVNICEWTEFEKTGSLKNVKII